MIEKCAEILFAGLCEYESNAITSGNASTLSTLCRRSRWVEAALLGVLLIHVHLHRAVAEAARAPEAA